jgi:hypothetical protein
MKRLKKLWVLSRHPDSFLFALRGLQLFCLRAHLLLE